MAPGTRSCPGTGLAEVPSSSPRGDKDRNAPPSFRVQSQRSRGLQPVSAAPRHRFLLPPPGAGRGRRSGEGAPGAPRPPPTWHLWGQGVPPPSWSGGEREVRAVASGLFSRPKIRDPGSGAARDPRPEGDQELSPRPGAKDPSHRRSEFQKSVWKRQGERRAARGAGAHGPAPFSGSPGWVPGLVGLQYLAAWQWGCGAQRGERKRGKKKKEAQRALRGRWQPSSPEEWRRPLETKLGARGPSHQGQTRLGRCCGHQQVPWTPGDLVLPVAPVQFKNPL
ncbi:translation initiation factor IF-2-like [Myotis myotis]|uniref:translation initiation factor IF-2-like n=1 Tax=Myotis myotis TaxID=51298 RepID=UPI00174C673D|nr:translation initiation factor IF-2-like [Myotis myotis]